MQAMVVVLGSILVLGLCVASFLKAVLVYQDEGLSSLLPSSPQESHTPL